MNNFEALEARQLLAFSANIDFSTAGATTASGYVKDTGKAYGSRGNGLTYGWGSDISSATRDRNATSDHHYDTFIHTQLGGSRTWNISVPNGTYRVRLVAGDPSYNDSTYRFNVENTLALSGTPTASNRFIDRTVTLGVTDGKLTVSNASGASNNKLAFLQITQTSTTASTSTQSPYGGSPIGLPGRIEAERFDNGGQGVSYSDTTSANSGGAFRSTGVDLYSGQNSSGTFVGATKAGEWLEYTINVATSGTYDFQFRLSSGSSGGALHVDVDGANKTGSIAVNNTGGWTTWKTVTKTGVYLTAGKHTLRLSFDRANVSGQDIGNVDWINILKSGGTSTSSNSTWPTSWRQSTNSPIPRFENYGFSYGGHLYTFGGFKDDTFKGVTRMDRFNPATGTWSYLGEMKAPETHAGLAVDTARGYAYFVNGYRGPYPASPTKEVWRYNINANSWTRLPDFPTVGGAGDAAVVNGKLHYFGGSKPDRVTNTGLHYALDLSNPSAGWQRKADQPQSRDHMSVQVYNGKIYAAGGEFGHDVYKLHQRIFQVYDPTNNTWTRLADAPISKSHAESSAFIRNGKFIWAGGQTYGSPDGQAGTSNVVAYDFASGRWSTLNPLPAARQGATVKAVGNVVVIANGGVTTYQPQRTVWIGNLS